MDVTKIEGAYEGPLMFIPGELCDVQSDILANAICTPQFHPHHGPRPFPLLAEARTAPAAVDSGNCKALERFTKSPVMQNIARAIAPDHIHCVTMGQWSPVHKQVAAILVVGKFDEHKLRKKRLDPDPCKRPPCAWEGLPVVYVYADESVRKKVALD